MSVVQKWDTSSKARLKEIKRQEIPMAEIKELIEKIQQDGIKAAEQKAQEIENKALKHADEIVQNAQKDARNALKDAQDRIAKMEEAANASLRQVARNTLLDLRKEVDAMLDKLVTSRIHEALSPAELAKLITTLVKDYSHKENAEITALLKKEDLEKIERGFLHDLKEAAKKGITLKAAGDITGGFIISYDAGKSHFDFTDKALAEYISQHLKPKLAGLLK